MHSSNNTMDNQLGRKATRSLSLRGVFERAIRYPNISLNPNLPLDHSYRLGDRAQGDAMMDRVLERAHKNYNLVPEEYNTVPALGPLGQYAGSIPMVGYGSGAYILSAFDRAGLYAPHDCQ